MSNAALPMMPIPSRTAHTSDAAATRILLRWLIGLRWAVFFFLAASLPLGDWLLGFHARYEIALPVIAAVVVFNAAMHRRLSAEAEVTTGAVAAGVALDLVAIGIVLAASGGAANPFSAVFFVHVALAASLLPARTTFALAGLAACLFAGLFALPSGACCPNHPANGAFSAHLYGMLIAFVIAAGLVAYFLTRVRDALDERGREIALLRRQAEENARFAGLGTLAAGTAHELATPLGTIAVLAGEIARGSDDMEAREGAGAISAQVARCRDILMKMQAGASLAKTLAAPVAVNEAVRRGVKAWSGAHPEAHVVLREATDAKATVQLSSDDLEAAVCALLDNALHATRGVSGADAIAVEIESDGNERGGCVRVVIEDAGTGVAPHLRGRLGEPFLTTKEPGEGMGLGLYLIRALVTEAGGRLEIAARDPQGTRITLHLVEASA